MPYTVWIFDADCRKWVRCLDCERATLRATVDACAAEIGMVWVIRDSRGIPIRHGDATGRKKMIADLDLPAGEKLLLWAQREFNPKLVQRVYADLVDVAAGNRPGNKFEREAIARVLGK